MTPDAFSNICHRLRHTAHFKNNTLSKVRERVAVALYKFGRSGNASGARDVANYCGCSEGSVHNWTKWTVAGLNEISRDIVKWATEEERQEAKAWVLEKSGVEEWTQGWAVVDGTQIDLAWKPARHPKEYFNYKRNYSMNVQLVFLPHSLRIIESVVGFPGSAQDSRVWGAGSKVLRQPRKHLDEGEFIWTDGGYGHSAFTVGPYSHIRASTVKDLRTFNFCQAQVRGRAEHAIAYFKQRFQSMMGY